MKSRIEICREYVLANKELPTRRIASILFTKYPHLFKSVESARDTVRLTRGTRGNKYDIAKAVQVRTPAQIELSLRHKQTLMNGCKPEYAVYPLPTDVKRWFNIDDLHLPYHDPVALQIAIKHAKYMGCDGIILNEVIDMYQASAFCKDPSAHSLAYEIGVFKEFIEMLKETFKLKRIIYKLGNHEARWRNYIWSHAPALYGLDTMTFEKAFDLDDMGIDMVDDINPIRFHSLMIVHGHEFKGGIISPVNPARGMFLKTLACTLSGHQHQTSSHSERTIQGVEIVCKSVGCLCQLNPRYMPHNRWNHGFAIVEINGKEWDIQNKRIVKGIVRD